MFGSHLLNSRSLMQIQRYNNKFRHKKTTVAEHSWFVTKVAYGLGTWQRNKFGCNVNLEKVLFFANEHDIIEVFTGDILGPLKHSNLNLKIELERIEKTIYETEIVNSLPQSWGKDYMMLHEEMSQLSTIESQIVKAADLIDRVFECMEEINLKNIDPFEDIIVSDLTKLYNMNIMAVNYFLKYSLKDIDAYKYIPEEIQKELENLDFSSYF